MAVINASQELGDYANIVAKAQIPTDVKQIVCNILAGKGLFNPLEGLSICLNVAIGDLLNDAGLGSASSALEEALNDLEAGLNDFIEHTGVNNALSRVNNAMNQIAAIYSMVNFCEDPMVAPNINTSLSGVIGSYTGAGRAILDELGAIGEGNISACVDGSGNFNFSVLDPSSILARIKNALDVGDPLGDFVDEVKANLNKMRDLMTKENTGDAPSQRVANAITTASVLKATFAQASSYKVDEANGLFDFFVDGDLLDILNNPTSMDALVQQRVPVYDYCGNLTGYQMVDLQGNATLEGPDTDPATNAGDVNGGQVFGTGAGPGDKTLGGISAPGSTTSGGGSTGGGSTNNFPTTLFVENLDIDTNFNNTSGLVVKVGNTPTNVEITGSQQQIVVTSGDGAAGNPLIGLANNIVLPGTSAVTVPKGATGDRTSAPVGGELRYSTDTNKFEVYLVGNSWHELLTDVDKTDILNTVSSTYALKTELSTGANVGTGTGQVFRDKTTNTLNFKTILAGSGITVTNNADDITITSTATGSLETIANVGSGEGIFKDITGTQANLKTLVAGNGITLTAGTDAITIDSVSADQYLIKANAQTTDAAGVTVPFNLQIPTDYSWFFTATFLGRRQGGIVERNAFKLEGVVDNTSGTVGLVGPAAYTVYQNNAQQWNVTVETSGTALIFKVYGEASKTINWTGHIRFQPTGENFTYQ